MTPAELHERAETIRSQLAILTHWPVAAMAQANKNADLFDALADVVEAARAQGGVVGGSPLQVALARVEALKP